MYEAVNHSELLFPQVSQFLTTLETDLSTGVGTRLDSVLGQCMYFGLSFSRVGADFRGLLVPIFQRAVLSDLIVSIRQADQHLEEAMQSYTLIGTSGLMTNTPLNVVSQVSQRISNSVGYIILFYLVCYLFFFYYPVLLINYLILDFK